VGLYPWRRTEMRDEWRKARYVAYGGPDVSWPDTVAYDIQRVLKEEGHDVRLQKLCEFDERGIGPDGAYVGQFIELYRVWVCWKAN
jgi:hypothetical protein